jgi:hypothetical protein
MEIDHSKAISTLHCLCADEIEQQNAQQKQNQNHHFQKAF